MVMIKMIMIIINMMVMIIIIIIIIKQWKTTQKLLPGKSLAAIINWSTFW